MRNSTLHSGAEALAAALTELLGSTELRRKLGKNAANEVRTTLMLDRIVDLELDLYARLVLPEKGLSRHAG